MTSGAALDLGGAQCTGCRVVRAAGSGKLRQSGRVLLDGVCIAFDTQPASERSVMGTAETSYQLGSDAAELERLDLQGRVLGPATRTILQMAGVGRGMRVLDLGSGAGDVAFVAAEWSARPEKSLGLTSRRFRSRRRKLGRSSAGCPIFASWSATFMTARLRDRSTRSSAASF